MKIALLISEDNIDNIVLWIFMYIMMKNKNNEHIRKFKNLL